ncbi:hypothetical protein MCEMSEM18_01419 [Comamonadaceae bacterium]
MSWLARLKEGKRQDRDASETTETVFVVSVAANQAESQNISGSKRHTTATISTAESAAADASIVSEGRPVRLELGHYPWPYSVEMSGAESDSFAARTRHFTAKGFTVVESVSLADQLLARDRDLDGRRYCLECRHLSGFGPSNWHCGNSVFAERATQQQKTALSSDLALQLQHCAGFGDYLLNSYKVRVI